MKEIRRRLDEDEKRDVVTVWFNAWRYEREPDLIVPLLDELRVAVANEADRLDGDARTALRRVAARLGQATRALAAGARINASLPGIGGVELNPQAVMEALQGQGAVVPASLYYSTFAGVEEAIRDLAGEQETPGRRVVIFVDDLDRCLPENALQVLEGMKLFFDVQGVVFVVGLDREVIERAIETKYLRQEAGAGGPVGLAVKGGDYIKKIFQVPYGLPRVTVDDLDAYFETLVQPLPFQQAAHLAEAVKPHLSRSLADGTTVNPREIKRLVNAYTLQLKVLHAKLGPEKLLPGAVMALQVMSFRDDWRSYYNQLTADVTLFMDRASKLLNPEPGGSPARALTLPASLLDYLRGLGRALFETEDLGAYIDAAEATRPADQSLVTANRLSMQLEERLKELSENPQATTEAEAVGELQQTLTSIHSALLARDASDEFGLIPQVSELIRRLGELFPQPVSEPWARGGELSAALAPGVRALTEAIILVRNQSSSGATTG